MAKRYSTSHTIVIATVSESSYCPHRHNDGQGRSIVAAFRLLSGGVQAHACLDSPEISSARCRGRLSGSSAAAPSDRTANVARERGPRARLDLAQDPQLVLTLVQPTGSTPIRRQACSSSPRAPPISSRAASATTNTTPRRACESISSGCAEAHHDLRLALGWTETTYTTRGLLLPWSQCGAWTARHNGATIALRPCPPRDRCTDAQHIDSPIRRRRRHRVIHPRAHVREPRQARVGPHSRCGSTRRVAPPRAAGLPRPGRTWSGPALRRARRTRFAPKAAHASPDRLRSSRPDSCTANWLVPLNRPSCGQVVFSPRAAGRRVRTDTWIGGRPGRAVGFM